MKVSKKISEKLSQYQEDWRHHHRDQSVACPTCTFVRTLWKTAQQDDKIK